MKKSIILNINQRSNKNIQEKILTNDRKYLYFLINT